MPTFGFVIDNRKCIGCHACTVACKSEHQVPLGVDRTWVKYIEKGSFPHNRRFFTVMRCNHCEWAPCVTICPVTALYRRDDGVVDFNSERCIGCKACMQACPYDALYIDPDTHTAAKCNFCAHRLDEGLQPSCVAVCPEQAIIAGDLDDPASEIARLLDRHPVQVRKPEKGTRPKLFYVEADGASLVPTATAAEGRSLWSRGEYMTAAGEPAQVNGRTGLPLVSTAGETRRVYDVRPRPAAWGWPVALYTWTKSIASGCFLAIVASWFLMPAMSTSRVSVPLGLVALVFLTITAGLLVLDLKQPRRFLYVLLRPQWHSWLTRGAYVLTAYGLVLTVWLLAEWLRVAALANALLGPGALLAVFAAVYTAFLFGQARGRDFWQNPLLPLHLLAHAFLAGAALWLLVEIFVDGGSPRAAGYCLAGTLCFSLAALLAELASTPPTTDAHLALEWITRGARAPWFWGAGVAFGHVLPLALLATSSVWAAAPAAVLTLAGMLAIERLWVQAPQQVPLS